MAFCGVLKATISLSNEIFQRKRNVQRFLFRQYVIAVSVHKGKESLKL